MPRLHSTFIGLCMLAVLAAPVAASAGQSPTSGTSETGPLVLRPIDSAIVFSPDVKVTNIDGAAATLAGGYAGKLIEQRVLVGAGAYWLADPRDDERLFYAGLILGARLAGTDRANLSVRSLFGIGHATFFETVQFAHENDRFGRHDNTFDSREFRIGFSDAFWMADPEIRLAIAINRLISLDVGAGYRLTAARRGFNDALRGATGSIGIRFNME